MDEWSIGQSAFSICENGDGGHDIDAAAGLVTLVVAMPMTMVGMTMTMVTTMVVMMRMVLMVATFPIEVNSVVRERSGGD